MYIFIRIFRMEWTKDKPTESGWYEFRGELHPFYIGTEPTSCEPQCIVKVDMGRKPKLQLLDGNEDFDFDAADGLWRGPFNRPINAEEKSLPEAG
jgi:hypothetical protein